jgi:hypothetical protein
VVICCSRWQAAKAGQLVYQLYGLLNGAPTTSEQLSSIQNQLNQVSVVLADIQGQISSLNQSLNKTEYGILNGQVSGQVSAIQDAESSFNAVLDMANQIGCGNYTAAGGVPASCTDPQSPAQVCTTAAEAANAALAHACVQFGDLPMPAGAVNFYGAPNYPLPSPAAAGSLVGLFISQVTSTDQFNDADVQKIAKTFGGSLIAGTAPGIDGMLQAIGQYASGNTFFTASDSQTVQDVYGFYMGVLAEGTTMRMAYDAFQGLPETSYGSSVDNMLTELHDLYVAAPMPLPAGTFIDPQTYTMWSGAIGALEGQADYLAQVKLGSTLTLPTVNAVKAQPTSAPTLAGGAPISNWAAAQQTDLKALTANIEPGSSTIGGYLTGVAGDGPGVWPNLLTLGVWDGRAHAFGGNYAFESGGGFIFRQTSDNASFDNVRGHVDSQIPVLLPTACPLTVSGCEWPVWSNGSASAMFDLRNGGDPAEVNLHGGDYARKNGPTAVQDFDNWTSDQKYCTKRYFWGSCDDSRWYSGVTNHIELPVLFQRTPTNTATECYYWPAAGDHAQGNGCPTGPPSPSQ